MLSITTYGRIDFPPLIFLHGFLGCKEDWKEMASLLQESFYCICLDLPGHGESPFQGNPLESIFQLLCSFPKASIIGYSLGGRIALMLQDLYPDIIKSLILLSPHPGLQSEKERIKKEQEEAKWIQLLEERSIDEFLTLWYDQPLFSSLKRNSSLYETTLKRRKKQDPKALIYFLKNFSLSKQKAFRKFSSPILFLYGEEDAKYAWLYKTLFDSVPVEKISQSGHAIHLENPTECAHIIKSFYHEASPCNN